MREAMRRIRHLAAISLAATMAGTVLFSGPASAATQDVTVDCVSGGLYTVYAARGDSISITGSPDACTYVYTDTFISAGYFSSSPDPGSSEPYVWTISETAPLGAIGSPPICLGRALFECPVQVTLVIVEARASDAAVPEWVQAYGRDKDATCADGWDASWQEWAQPVTGGWVCTRSIPAVG